MSPFFVVFVSAYAASGCEMISQTVFGESLSKETKYEMKYIRRNFPLELVLDDQKVEVNQEELEQLIKVGYDPTLIEVREIASLVSPCRYFCPPWYRSFGVVAKRDVPAGTFVSMYMGELEESVQHTESNYVFSLPQEEARSYFGNKYNLPDLIVDSCKKGNIARFFNDSSYRNGHYSDPK